MKYLPCLAFSALLVAGLARPASADEVEDSLRMALDAYLAGDLKTAKEEADFASQLLTQMQAAGLGEFLPQPLPDWTRSDPENQAQAAAMFGGGMTASASYSRGNDRIEIQIMADNQMVTAMAGMFGNAAVMGSLGQVKRINRQKVVITQSGELQAMVGNRIFVQISGQAAVEDKEAYFAAIDVRGLENL